ncbi:MAG: hypothetical protein V3V00_01590 [Saprospiraceae bacterium]
MKGTILKLILLISANLISLSIFTQNKANTQNTYVILDASGSMWGKLNDGDFKIAAARSALTSYLDNIDENHNIAFRAYGHNREKDCNDTELLMPFTRVSEAKEKISSMAKNMNPKGRTPIGNSLIAAIKDIGDTDANIILISDGLETCNADPCALIKAWKDKNIHIKVHVVGLGLTEKEKETLQCITDISGGTFKDAQSADDLAQGLSNISQKKKNGRLTIQAITPKGEKIYVHCIVDANGMAKSEGRRDQSFAVRIGTVNITVGIMTINGVTYKPITKEIAITNLGETNVKVTVKVPPMVYSKFIEKEEERKGVIANVIQNGKEALKLRPAEWKYIMPGSYKFLANLNADNHLSISETFTVNDRKEILFYLRNTVKVKIITITSIGNKVLRFHSGLYQKGEKKYSIHRSNGKDILPGIYDIHLNSKLTPFHANDIEITSEKTQTINITVPVGVLKVDYADKNGIVMDIPDKRIYLSRQDTEGKWQKDALSTADGKPIYLVEGTYKLVGWTHLGNFNPIEFTIKAGEHVNIKMKDKK